MADCLEKPPTKGFEFTVIYVDNCTGVVKDAFGTNTYDPRGGTVELEAGCSGGKEPRFERLSPMIVPLHYLSGKTQPLLPVGL